MEITRGGGRKILFSSLGGSNKIYRPEGPIFGPKHCFFILRDMLSGQFSILTKIVGKKIIELTRGMGKKINSSNSGRGLEQAMQYKNLSIM